jgi:ABC-type branched-subunit amino acid transport system substrate-binding protein
MRRPLIAGVCLALAVAAAGCGKAEEQNPSSGGGGGSNGPGVTDKTITLGALMDLTNVFAAGSKGILEGTNLYWDSVNADGGVCGRQVKLDVQDHGYDPQKAVSLYRDMSPNVLGVMVLGSPVISALKPSFDQDDMLVTMAAWTSTVLPDEHFLITGATYDLETINAIDWLTREHGLQKGDTVGIVYFEGDYGGNALQGAQYAADKLGLTLQPYSIKPSDTDLSAQVNSMKDAGVKAILVGAAAPQSASIASVAASIGLDVPIVGNDPSFGAAVLNTPAAPALEKNFYVSGSVAPPSLDATSVKEFLAAFQKAHPDEQPDQNGAMYGYATGQIVHEVLSKSCDDLTREGVLKALRGITDYDSGGSVAGTLDYSDPSVPPTREVYISQADSSVPGGLKKVSDAFESDLAKQYTFGG